MFPFSNACRGKWNAADALTRHICESRLRLQHQLTSATWEDFSTNSICRGLEAAESPDNIQRRWKSSRSWRRSELPKLVLEYRQLAKLKSTYIDAIPKLTTPRPTVTVPSGCGFDGSSSSSNPNLQNIPVRADLTKIRGPVPAKVGGFFGGLLLQVNFVVASFGR
jgi:hypothetical protein